MPNDPYKKLPKIAVPSSSSSAPPWIELPGELTANILRRLGMIEILISAQKVCTTWRKVCQDPFMWRVIHMKNPGHHRVAYNLKNLCHQGVNRSQGQLIDIHIEYFGDDDLLHYIARRKGLIKALQNLPQLEELHLSVMPLITARDIETIHTTYPALKSCTTLKMNMRTKKLFILLVNKVKEKLKMSNNPYKKLPKIAVPSSSSSAPPWIELPGELTANILRRLGMVEVLKSAQKVCTTWRKVCQDPSMWRVIHMKNPVHDRPVGYNLKNLCQHVVNRSRGQLIDIHIEHFGDDHMLHHIARRSSKLNRLTLACCYRISSKGLIKALQKLPQLEELHLSVMPLITARDIGTIRASCPTLKSFTYMKT
ncbi:hypothetical protein BUALT_Bualt03G0224900 [Buddleja alternifolia]|uniref:F-box domain-containing protein n=1 Tax=Buddleja alternifolia TaxID=168488 RepID=A0AAV6Y2R8_9LAMI|nr:hypothetical protein BUALT_Bualt03G0224900 [Buddleja alternifolia]